MRRHRFSLTCFTVIVLLVVVLAATGNLSVKASTSAGVKKTVTKTSTQEQEERCACMPLCDQTVPITGSTREELQLSCNANCEEACPAPAPAPAPNLASAPAPAPNLASADAPAPAPRTRPRPRPRPARPADAPAPLVISHKMDKETFYTIMGWDSDTVQPWQRWGLVGPQMTPPAGADLLPYIIVLLIFVILGVWAAARSWKYNNRMVYNGVFKNRVLPPSKPVNTFARCIYAVVAFYFGPIYLLIEAISDRQMIFKLLQDENLFPKLESFAAQNDV